MTITSICMYSNCLVAYFQLPVTCSKFSHTLKCANTRQNLLPLLNQRTRFFFCVRCDDHAKSSGWWLLGSLPPTAVVRQLAPRARCPLQCLLAKTVGVLSPGVGRSEECAQEFAPQSHIHSGLNQQDLVSSDVFLSYSDQYADGRWGFGSSCQVY